MDSSGELSACARADSPPGGIGAKRSPPLWMKAGDVVEVEVDRIGVLSNPIVDEESARG